MAKYSRHYRVAQKEVEQKPLISEAIQGKKNLSRNIIIGASIFTFVNLFILVCNSIITMDLKSFISSKNRY